MNRIYPSMQRNEKCFAANQLHDAVKRLCNFAANWLHYAAKQLCSKVTRHQNCHTTAYISYAWSNLILFHTSTMNRVETCLNHKCMGLSRNLTKLSCLIEMCDRKYSSTFLTVGIPRKILWIATDICKTSSVQTFLYIRGIEREEFKKKKYNMFVIFLSWIVILLLLLWRVNFFELFSLVMGYNRSWCYWFTWPRSWSSGLAHIFWLIFSATIKNLIPSFRFFLSTINNLFSCKQMS